MLPAERRCVRTRGVDRRGAGTESLPEPASAGERERPHQSTNEKTDHGVSILGAVQRRREPGEILNVRHRRA